MPNLPDVVVIGGGISGAATAYELARSGASVVLIERDQLAAMASGWTLGGVRQSGRHAAELPLARAAVQRWERLADELDAELEYCQGGNLRLARTPEEVPVIAALVEEGRAQELDLTFLADNGAVRAVAPGLSETVLAASYCPTDGHANPILTVHAFADAAVRHGATIQTETEVTGIEVVGGRAQGVTTTRGSVAADAVVVTAGVYSDRLCRPLGIDLPLTVAHVAVVQTVPLPPLIQQVIGVATADLAGRQEVDGRMRMTSGAEPWQWPAGGITPDAVQPPAAAVLAVLDRAIEVLPSLARASVARIWGGLIDMTPDALPVIERVNEVEGLVIAAGFSGHGFCLGPVTGQITRGLVTSGESTLPIDAFHRSRLATAVADAAVELHG